MAIYNYITPFKNVHRRVVEFHADVLDGTATHAVADWKQGMWASLVDGKAIIDDDGDNYSACHNGGIVFDIKPSFGAASYPERLTIISDQNTIVEVDSDAYDSEATFANGVGLTVENGLWTNAFAEDKIIAICELKPTDNNGYLRLKLAFDVIEVTPPL